MIRNQLKLSAIILAASAALAAPANAQGLLGGVTSALSPTTLTPGLIGNTVQVGVGKTRVGSTTGLVGTTGTPTTVVGVSVLGTNNPPVGSAASVGIANKGAPLVTLATPR